MSDLKPSELTAEERAIVDHEASRFHRDWTAEARYKTAFDICKSLILARRALFAPPASEEKHFACDRCRKPLWDHESHRDEFGNYSCKIPLPSLPASEEKVECPNCKKSMSEDAFRGHLSLWGTYICQPAQPELGSEAFDKRVRAGAAKIALGSAGFSQPEPAATEMPEADLTFHINRLESMIGRNVILGDLKESVFALIVWARKQPVTPPLAMSEELEEVLEFAQETTEMTNAGGDEVKWFWNTGYCEHISRKIAAVRAQVAAPKVVKMEKVRELIRAASSEVVLRSLEQGGVSLASWKDRIDAARAEIDAHEGRKP